MVFAQARLIKQGAGECENSPEVRESFVSRDRARKGIARPTLLLTPPWLSSFLKRGERATQHGVGKQQQPTTVCPI